MRRLITGETDDDFFQMACVFSVVFSFFFYFFPLLFSIYIVLCSESTSMSLFSSIVHSCSPHYTPWPMGDDASGRVVSFHITSSHVS